LPVFVAVEPAGQYADCMVRGGEWVDPSISSVGDPAMPSVNASVAVVISRVVTGRSVACRSRSSIAVRFGHWATWRTSRFMLGHHFGRGIDRPLPQRTQK
jgi:hypothetical protein